MDKTELGKQVRNSIEKLTSLRLRVSAGLLSNEVIAARIGVVLDGLNETMRQLDGQETREFRLLPLQSMSDKDKIARLDEEIAELEEFTFINAVNNSYDVQKLGIMKRALEDLREYRGLVEGDIRKRYTEHPAHDDRLKDDEILALYKKLESYRAVGRKLGCDAQTVKNRLVRMGYKKSR